jgi:hypothetical protein
LTGFAGCVFPNPVHPVHPVKICAMQRSRQVMRAAARWGQQVLPFKTKNLCAFVVKNSCLSAKIREISG